MSSSSVFFSFQCMCHVCVKFVWVR